MPKTNHSSLTSTPDHNDNVHRVDIDPHGARKSDKLILYKGKCFSSHNDPRNNQSIVAKFPKNGTIANANWATKECKRAQNVRNAALKFKNVMKSMHPAISGHGQASPFQITVMVPQSACLNSVSFLDKSREVGQFFVFEDKLKDIKCFLDTKGRVVTHKSKLLKRQKTVEAEIDWEECEMAAPAPELNNLPPTHAIPSAPPMPCDYTDDMPPTYEESQRATYGILPPYTMNNTNVEWYLIPSCPPAYQDNFPQEERPRSDSTSSNSSFSKVRNVPQIVLQAFIHFFFSQTNGKEIIANLQGTYDEDEGYILTTPTIHSLKRQSYYGEKDMGENGMIKVINNHQCSKLCSHLPDMHQLFQSAKASCR